MAKVWAPYGGIPPGEDRWPDRVTFQAVAVIDHPQPSDARSAIFVGPEAEPELTTGERAQLRDSDFMRQTGWFS